MTIPSRRSSLAGRCASCGRRISFVGCLEHGGPILPPAAGDEDAETADGHSFARSFPGYEVERILGRGGFGTVYQARDQAGTRVAIKHSHANVAESGARLLREAEVLAAVKPPHVPALLEHGAFSDGTQFIVMELVEAPPLADLLLLRGACSIAESLTIAAAILKPLAAVHASGYVHRDLKPENVLYDEHAERAVLVDFGLARMHHGHANGFLSELTVAGTLVGTTDYMAPEQHDGRLDLEAAADVYAMGVILFELLTGRAPFCGPAALVREAHRSQRPPRPSLFVPGIGSALEDVILRCLSKSPDDRPAHAAALAAALEEAQRKARQTQSTNPPPRYETEAVRRPRTELRMVSVLNFVSSLDGIALRRYLEPKGAQIVHSSAGRYVVAFGHEIDANPARRALHVARGLLAEGHAKHVFLDVTQVSVRSLSNGTYRIFAPHLTRAAHVPSGEAAAGLVLSSAARSVVQSDDWPVDSAPAGSFPPPSFSSDTLLSSATHSFGRQPLLEEIVTAASKSVAEAITTAVVVVGEPGMGKSHFRRTLASRFQLALPQAHIVSIQAHSPAEGTTSGILRELLLHALDLPPSLPSDVQGLLASRLGSQATPVAIAALALAMGWIAPGEVNLESAVARPLAALEAAPGAIRTQITATAAAALRRCARRAPLLILLDDAHFADDVAVAVLEQATSGDEGVPIFVGAFGLPSFHEIHPAFGRRANHHAVHTLGPLEAEDAASLCRELLRPAENVPASAIERIVERTQAIPLLLVELVRGLKAAGAIRPHSTGVGHYLVTDELGRLPELPLIEWLAHRELDALPEAVRAHARLAAVLGVEVTKAELEGVHRWLDRAGLGNEFPLDARIGSNRLVALGVFVQAGRGRYRFRHGLLREAIAHAVAEDVRLAIHRAAIHHWCSVNCAQDAAALAKLAHHAACAGEKGLAESASSSLAELARARHDYLEAERAYTHALDQSTEDDGPRKRAAWRGRGLMRYRLGRYADAQLDLGAARRSAERAGDVLGEADILLDEATVLDWMGEYAASAQCVNQALAKVASIEVPPLLAARLLLGQGRSLHRASREEEARIELERAIAATESLGEEGYETRVIALLMSSFILQGLARLEDAAEALHQTVALCESHGDSLHLAAAVNNRGLLVACLGDKPAMVADFERVITLGQHLGQYAIQAAGHYNLGEYLYLWGDLDAAEPHVQRALELEMRRTGNAPRAVIALLPARLALYRGDVPAARDIVARVRSSARGVELAPSVDVLCAMVENACGDVDEAVWDALESRSQEFSIGQERIEVIEARVLAAFRRGDVAEARGHLARAIELAETIPNVLRQRLGRGVGE